MFVHVIFKQLSTQHHPFWNKTKKNSFGIKKFLVSAPKPANQLFQRYVFLKIKTMNAKNSRLGKNDFWNQQKQMSKWLFGLTKVKSFWNERHCVVDNLLKCYKNVKIQASPKKWMKKKLFRVKKKNKKCVDNKNKCFGQKHECDWFLRKKSTLKTKFW